jgi:hypothetical protein
MPLLATTGLAVVVSGVTGGLLVLSDREGMKRSTMGTAAKSGRASAGKHDPSAHEAFHADREETFKGTQSPKITPCSRPNGGMIRRSGGLRPSDGEWFVFNRNIARDTPQSSH